MTVRTRHDLAGALVDIGAVRPHPRNARNGDIDAIAESLRVNGQYRPIVIAREGTILAGNHTYMAAMEIGWDVIAAVRLDLDPESPEAHRIMLADNRTADLGNYDRGLLVDLLQNLDDGPGLVGTGYDGDDLTRLLAQINDEGPIEVDDGPDPGVGGFVCPQCGFEAGRGR
jgi:hypothetical protein